MFKERGIRPFSIVCVWLNRTHSEGKSPYVLCQPLVSQVRDFSHGRPDLHRPWPDYRWAGHRPHQHEPPPRLLPPLALGLLHHSRASSGRTVWDGTCVKGTFSAFISPVLGCSSVVVSLGLGGRLRMTDFCASVGATALEFRVCKTAVVAPGALGVDWPACFDSAPCRGARRFLPCTLSLLQSLGRVSLSVAVC